MTVGGPRVGPWGRGPRASSPRRGFRTRRPGNPITGLGAASWYDARDLLTTTQQTLTSRVGSGTATLGSTGSSDTNDPLVLPGSGYVYFPGTAFANNLSIADHSSLNLSGDFELILDITPYKVTGAASAQALIHRPSNYQLYLFNTGVVRLQWWNGSANVFADTTVSLPTADGVAFWFRATLDIDNGSGSRVVTFYTGTNGVDWTQLGATVTGAVTTVGSTAAALSIGATAGFGEAFQGQIRRLIIKSGLGGSSVLDINPATESLGQTTWTCTTGQTVTVNRATSGLATAVVTRPLLMADGTDDYLQLPAGDTPTFTATTGAYTVMLINRVHNLAGAAALSRVWSSESASAVGAHIYLDQTNAQYKALVGGTSTVATAAATFTQTTQLHAVAAVFSAGTAYAYTTTTGLTAGANYSGVGTVAHATPRIGSRADSVANAADMETYAVVHWTRALTATELDAASAYLLGNYA